MKSKKGLIYYSSLYVYNDNVYEYDLHFMRLTGVIAPDGGPGPNEYDEDEAFEYVYDAWLGDNPGEEDEDMTVALLLDCFMELWHEYLRA